jgi:uncharacterized protein
MTSRQPDPRRLDVAAAAAEALALEGRWPLIEFGRLVEAPAQDGEVQWSLRGQRRQPAGGEPETWLHLQAQTRVWRDCQRCLQPVALDLEVARAFRFVADEAIAEALDAESEDDVLALPRRLDVHELVEDELLLALPLVPMHAECPQSLPTAVGFDALDVAVTEPVAKPFAALASLKRGRPG